MATKFEAYQAALVKHAKAARDMDAASADVVRANLAVTACHTLVEMAANDLYAAKEALDREVLDEHLGVHFNPARGARGVWETPDGKLAS